MVGVGVLGEGVVVQEGGEDWGEGGEGEGA